MAEFNKGSLLQKTEEYMDYIKTHKENVHKAWEKLKAATVNIGIINRPNILSQMGNRIGWHDESKYSEREFLPYRRHFYPMDGEVDDTAQYEVAWKHHYNCNDHHWQYWVDEDGNFTSYADVDDRMCACLEMICDWEAMGYVFGDSAAVYYKNHKDEIKLHPDWAMFVDDVLELLENYKQNGGGEV